MPGRGRGARNAPAGQRLEQPSGNQSGLFHGGGVKVRHFSGNRVHILLFLGIKLYLNKSVEVLPFWVEFLNDYNDGEVCVIRILIFGGRLRMAHRVYYSCFSKYISPRCQANAPPSNQSLLVFTS